MAKKSQRGGAAAPAQTESAATDTGSVQAQEELKDSAESETITETDDESLVVDLDNASETEESSEEESDLEEDAESAATDTPEQELEAAEELDAEDGSTSKADENTDSEDLSESKDQDAVDPDAIRRVRIYANLPSDTTHPSIGADLKSFRWSETITCTEAQLARFKSDGEAICAPYEGWSFEVEDVK